MARGHNDPSDGDNGDSPVLSPDELDISDDEHVVGPVRVLAEAVTVLS